MDRDADALDELQDRLLTHFQSLARTREPSGFPVSRLNTASTQRKSSASAPYFASAFRKDSL